MAENTEVQDRQHNASLLLTIH